MTPFPVQAFLFGPDESRGGGPLRRADDVLGMPEAEAIESIRVGDEATYTRVYSAMFPRLVDIARAYVPVAVAEEIAQDALLMLWERRGEWPAMRGIAVHLYTVVRRRAIDQARHAGVVGRVAGVAVEEHEALGSGAPDIPADERVERNDLAAAIARAVARLPERPRTAFVLRWVHQLGYAEVANIMGITEVAARKQVSRAREALLEVLRDVMGV